MRFFPDSSTLLVIGSFSLRWYAVTLIAGIVAAYQLMSKGMKAHGYDVDTVDEILVLCMIGGVIGGRVFWVLENLSDYMKYIPYIFAISDGGFDILGASIGISAMLVYYCVRRHMSTLRTMDVIMPAIFLFAVIARFGRSFSDLSIWLANGIDLIGFLLLYFFIRPYHEGRRRGDVAAIGFMWLALSRMICKVFGWDPTARGVLIPAAAVELFGILLYAAVHKRKPTKPIVLFDLDGTIMDTRSMVIQCFKYLFMKYNDPRNFTKEKRNLVFRVPLREAMTTLFPDQDPDMLVDEYKKYQNSFSWSDSVSLFPNVKTTLDELWQNGYLLGIVSTRLTSSCESWLRQLDLSHCFGTILGRDLYEDPKPEPGGILYAGKKLKRGHDSCVYVGDGLNDIRAAKAAGVYSVAFVSDPSKKEALEELQPNKVITDMKELVDLLMENHEWADENC